MWDPHTHTHMDFALGAITLHPFTKFLPLSIFYFKFFNFFSTFFYLTVEIESLKRNFQSQPCITFASGAIPAGSKSYTHIYCQFTCHLCLQFKGWLSLKFMSIVHLLAAFIELPRGQENVTNFITFLNQYVNLYIGSLQSPI